MLLHILLSELMSPGGALDELEEVAAREVFSDLESSTPFLGLHDVWPTYAVSPELLGFASTEIPCSSSTVA